MIPRFSCGHYRTAENMSGKKNPRCKTCEAQYRVNQNIARREKRYIAKLGVNDLFRVVGEPIEGSSPFVGYEEANHRFLSALYREHPYVFDAAERYGRLAVRP